MGPIGAKAGIEYKRRTTDRRTVVISESITRVDSGEIIRADVGGNTRTVIEISEGATRYAILQSGPPLILVVAHHRIPQPIEVHAESTASAVA